MAKAATPKQPTIKRGDIEVKGKKARGTKRTSIGKSKNSRPTNKNAVRNRKGK